MKNQMGLYICLAASLFLLLVDISYAKTVSNVSGEGSCVIEGMSAEQARLTAVQRARAMAIEEAVGVQVSSSSIVKDFALAADFIKTYSKGFIVREEVKWQPIEQYWKDTSSAPIPEYRVKILADVYIPEKMIAPLGVHSKLNSTFFKDGDKAKLNITVERKAKIAIFNITANDEIVMIFPNKLEKNNIIRENDPIVFPSTDSKIDFVVRNIKGHKRDVEAVFIVAMDAGHNGDFMKIFTSLTPMSFNIFFQKLSEIADYCEDIMLTYEVVNNKHDQ